MALANLALDLLPSTASHGGLGGPEERGVRDNMPIDNGHSDHNKIHSPQGAITPPSAAPGVQELWMKPIVPDDTAKIA